MRKFGLLILALTATLVIQNTCPQGWAAKTAFGTCGQARQSSHCPMHEQQKSAKHASDESSKKELSNAKQIFVLGITRPENSFQIFAPAISLSPVKPDLFRNISSEPLFRPPISFELS